MSDYVNTEKNEVERIKEKYSFLPKEKSDLERLREIDRKAETPPRTVSLTIGIIGTLIAGGGMALILENIAFTEGIILGIVGILVMLPAYPVYKSMSKKMRKKYAEQVNEIIKNNPDFQ